MGLAVGPAGLGHEHVRAERDAVLVLTVANARRHTKHAGAVRVITRPRRVTVHSERLTLDERVRRGRAAVPESRRTEDTRGSHRADQRGLKRFVCRPVARIHHAQLHALPAVPHRERGGGVHRGELPRGVDRRARSRRVVAGEVPILRRLPTRLCRTELRWTRGHDAGVARVLVRARRLLRAGRRTGEDYGGQAHSKYQECNCAWSLPPPGHDATVPAWSLPSFHI